MVIFRISIIFVYLLFAGIFASPIFAQEELQFPKKENLMSELTPAQRRMVESGGQVMTTLHVPKSPWPAVKIYQIISALPEEIIAVFFDYERAYTYVPHVEKSQISKKINSRTQEVDYSINIPLLPNEQYTIQSSLHVLPGNVYEIDWKLLRATTTRASEGNFRVQAYRKNQSVICYFNFVVPGSRLAIVLRGIALEQVQKNVEALIQQVEKQKKQNPKSLQQQMEAVRQALKEPL